VKRFFDIVISASLLVALAPVLILVAALIRLSMGRPILFVQPRPGKWGKVFHLIKFRTMSAELSENPRSTDESQRVTALGRILRRTSLDELPQLWNVLRGDMSLVGPRPLLVEYLPLYSDQQNRRHEVRPGITGWAQVNGRNAISWEDKFRLDVWYVDNQSIALDLRILACTLIKAVLGSGVNQSSVVIAEKFMGTKHEK
jgi:lipopolysaccharide/colanic/teichoic acid biosynthesis glycosyltransferase